MNLHCETVNAVCMCVVANVAEANSLNKLAHKTDEQVTLKWCVCVCVRYLSAEVL